MPCRVTQDRGFMVASSNKMWFTGEGNGKPLQHSCLKNTMNNKKLKKKKKQEDTTPKDELPRSTGAQ